MSQSTRRIVYAALHLGPPLAIPGAVDILYRRGLLSKGDDVWGQILYTAFAAGILASAYLAIGRVRVFGREWRLTPDHGRGSVRDPHRTTDTP